VAQSSASQLSLLVVYEALQFSRNRYGEDALRPLIFGTYFFQRGTEAERIPTYRPTHFLDTVGQSTSTSSGCWSLEQLSTSLLDICLEFFKITKMAPLAE
jgi:hypothetical protein